MRRAVLTAAAAVVDGRGAVRDALVDANRLRRMDRFGRSGALAGSRALAAAGRTRAVPGAEPDPRTGVVVGTALGCRDAITRHLGLLASAARVEDLAPSVFAATVHNAVGGELAIAWGLGGVAETLVSGKTAGLEALVLAARRVAEGDADRILVVAAEGIDDEMRAAWERENAGRTLVESAAAVLVEAEEEESSRGRATATLVHAELGFEAAARDGAFEENEGTEDFLESVGEGGAGAAGDAVMERLGGPGIERLGATGLWEVASDLVEFLGETQHAIARNASPMGERQPHTPSKKSSLRRYRARDVHGSRAAVTLAFFS